MRLLIWRKLRIVFPTNPVDSLFHCLRFLTALHLLLLTIHSFLLLDSNISESAHKLCKTFSVFMKSLLLLWLLLIFGCWWTNFQLPRNRLTSFFSNSLLSSLLLNPCTLSTLSPHLNRILHLNTPHYLTSLIASFYFIYY
jgi:hypothetical protein